MRLLLPFFCLLIASSAAAQSADPGRTIYATRCAGCHGSNGGGGELGPSIVSRVPARTDEELTTVVRQGLPTAGMPASPNLADAEVRDLIGFLRTLRPREGSGPVRTKIALASGGSLEGLILNQGTSDLQLLGRSKTKTRIAKMNVESAQSVLIFKSFPVRIFIVALILRLIPVILARGLGIGLDDMFQYDMLARSLTAGNGFRWYAQEDLNQLAAFVDFDLSSVKDYDPGRGIPTSFRAPLYPLFLAIVYFINGIDSSRFFAARLAQAIFLGAPLAPLTYWVARHLFSVSSFKSSEKAARIAAWIVACYPMLLVYPLGLGTENPFFVLLLSSFLFLLRSIEKPTVSNLLLSGFFLALTTLTRSVILPFALAAFCLLLVLHRKQAILTILSFLLVLSPWVIRNSILHHKLTGIETSMGYNLYLGYHPQGNGSFVFGPSLDLLTILDDAERDRIGTEKAIEFIKAQPERFIPLAINRLGFFFGLEKRVLMYFYGNNILGYVPPPLLLTISAILLLPFVIISVSAAFGLAYLRWKPEHILLVLLFVGYILPHVLILSEDRFHLALLPYIAILAAQVWVNRFAPLRARWNEAQTGKFIVSLAVLAAILLVTNWNFELIRDADKIAQLLGPNGNQSYFPY